MIPFIKRLILAGLAILPAACATYSHGYYDTGYSYSPGYYGSGYGYSAVQPGYYNTYVYPTPAYRTEEYHHHYHYDDHDHDRRYPDQHEHNGRRSSTSHGVIYRKPDSRKHDTNGHYNWNAQTAKPYDNRNRDRDRQEHEGRHEGWQHRPTDPNAFGQWRRQQNWNKQEDRRQNSHLGERPRAYGGAKQQWPNGAPTMQRDGRDGQHRQRAARWGDREQLKAQNSR